MGDFQKLDVWKKSHVLAVDITHLTTRMKGPAGSTLRGQLRRSAQSTPATIAEGAAKMSDPEFARFLDMALASAGETHNHLLLARDTHLITDHDFDPLADRVAEIRRMLVGLIRTVRGPGNEGDSS